MPVEGILLAAGESRRMGFPKPLLRLGNQTFVALLSQAMLEAVARLTVVIGAHADRVRPAVPADPQIRVVVNQQWPQGQLSSLKAGLRQLGPDCDAVVVHLIDHPTVSAATFRALVASRGIPGRSIVVARRGARRGHPVIFERNVFEELLATPEDLGARVVVDADRSR
ncbi:MAG TPA: nucleotidyltransferase family protein, partial [Candidatus Binataceae bacterium]|nr:nucleotidyltransferase family protein [Candidatus Binataceae bacterium]